MADRTLATSPYAQARLRQCAARWPSVERLAQQIFAFRLRKRPLGHNLNSIYLKPLSRTNGSCPIRGLWSTPIRHHLLRSSLHSGMLVVIFFPVPPSTRQAAGPLTENLPHVCLSDRKTVDLLLERPSPRGTKRRLSAPVLPWPPVVHGIFAGWNDAFDLERRNGLGANANRLTPSAAGKRLTTKRGHLA